MQAAHLLPLAAAFQGFLEAVHWRRQRRASAMMASVLLGAVSSQRNADELTMCSMLTSTPSRGPVLRTLGWAVQRWRADSAARQQWQRWQCQHGRFLLQAWHSQAGSQRRLGRAVMTLQYRLPLMMGFISIRSSAASAVARERAATTWWAHRLLSIPLACWCLEVRRIRLERSATAFCSWQIQSERGPVVRVLVRWRAAVRWKRARRSCGFYWRCRTLLTAWNKYAIKTAADSRASDHRLASAAHFANRRLLRRVLGKWVLAPFYGANPNKSRPEQRMPPIPSLWCASSLAFPGVSDRPDGLALWDTAVRVIAAG